MMAAKAGYRVMYIDELDGTRRFAAVCPCLLGFHNLRQTLLGVVEETADDGVFFVFNTYAEAQAAIEQWQRQHADAQAHSGESEEAH